MFLITDRGPDFSMWTTMILIKLGFQRNQRR